ncbi:adaptor-related protein complex 3, sigma 2 subunit, putative [Eimeria mitis]|uniref:Adaptor-related protein complex 3, sigma 2 subunit, putative n=1 Tax=Eimeria mitis TaxID=44415 RepID=U6KF74_9EIME|nr:adaptor-related protein complex 3, sigma 2 subunit, putative [Eimeria mitis]CDJ34872.1 adaptor-related protein complex 3, sigma 2 subunit, putative [Eimeria mitis]
MIKSVVVVNTQGKPRIVRFYDGTPQEKQQHVMRSLFAAVSRRPDEGCCCFTEDPELFGPNHRIIYRAATATLATPDTAAAAAAAPAAAVGAAAAVTGAISRIADAAAAAAAAAATVFVAAVLCMRWLLYRHFATLYFIFVTDHLESELGILDLIQNKRTAASEYSTEPSQQLQAYLQQHFATLYFIFVTDHLESELGILDLIQVFVQVLDACFENVCELDLVFHYDKINFILDEIIVGGLVMETAVDNILESVSGVKKLVDAETSFFA